MVVPMAEAYDLENQKDLSVAALLLGFEYSGNKEKTLVYFSTKATAAERESMRAAYAFADVEAERLERLLGT